ncbi:hypothetical protein, partial [Phytoactinopolyspora endophytica]|uniref:hypothetical protein n=1 Tax=Phytoactinopolyspora endophytica TaxID=1642495 RepID=UPI00197B240B
TLLRNRHSAFVAPDNPDRPQHFEPHAIPFFSGDPPIARDTAVPRCPAHPASRNPPVTDQ